MAGKCRRKLRQQTTAAELSDDLILEIVARLPLRYALQCSVLNKTIRRQISDPNFLPYYSAVFHCSDHDSKVFTSIWQEIMSNSVHPLRRSVTVGIRLFIKASCNGLLLLCVDLNKFFRHYYIFNPTTAAIMAVDRRQIESYDSVGLAVPDDNSGFKLVALDVVPMSSLVFTVLVPFGNLLYVKSQSRVSQVYYFKLMAEEPVYANGSLYWLSADATVIVAFYLEEEKVRFVRINIGPVRKNEINDVVYKWFGLASGSIYFVYAAQSETVICVYDDFNYRKYEKTDDKWHVKHRISNICSPPLFFDGRALLFLERNSGEEGGDVYRYDLARDSSQKIESVDCEPKFFSYTSSFVEVSDTYLDEKSCSFWSPEGRRRNVLLGLQKLLMPTRSNGGWTYKLKD